MSSAALPLRTILKQLRRLAATNGFDEAQASTFLEELGTLINYNITARH